MGSKIGKNGLSGIRRAKIKNSTCGQNKTNRHTELLKSITCVYEMRVSLLNRVSTCVVERPCGKGLGGG